MAFDFPDPNVTPEFTAPNGFTYIYDQGQALWKLAKKEPVPTRVIQSVKTISTGDLPKRPSGSNWRMQVERNNSSDPFYTQYPEAGFRWMGQNPETGRLIYYSDKWFGYSDDEGQTWRATSKIMYMHNPGTGTAGKNGITRDGCNKSQNNLFTWCGGKKWVVATDSYFGYILYTLDDFENIYSCRFYSDNSGFDSKPWRSIKYDPVNDEIWSTWGNNKIVQLDSDLTKWLNSDLGNDYGDNLLKYSDGPDKGVLFKKQVYLRHAYWSGSTAEGYFSDIALSPHGTKLAYSNYGILVRTEDNFNTWEEINTSVVYNDPYYAKQSSSGTREVIPGSNYNRGRVKYIEETGVWIFTTRNSFQVSFDDGISWVEMDYKTRGTKEDTIFMPYIRGDYESNSSTPPNYRYYYYFPFSDNYNSGYLKGNYYYITQEVGDPKWSTPTHFSNMDDDQKEIVNSWCTENVMYVTPDFKNWTRIPYGIDNGSYNSTNGSRATGNQTAFISHQPGVDRMFILSDGYYEQTPYRVNYIDGFN